jgi:hypothetical protein
MWRTIGLVVALAGIATPALAQKVQIDYAHASDFKGLETFQLVAPEEAPVNPLMASRIETMIRDKLRASGLEHVEQDPDLFVTYHVTAEQVTSYNTTYSGYGGYGYGWRSWGVGMGSAVTTESTYTEGTLIIDAWEPAEKKMVWRGTGTVTVKAKPEKQVEQVAAILDKLGKKWQKILAGAGK